MESATNFVPFQCTTDMSCILFVRNLCGKFGNSFHSFCFVSSNFDVIILYTGSCPAPMAIGETGSGKSTCLQLIHKLLGGTLVSQSSGKQIKSTFPLYWDNLAHPKTVKKVHVMTFQGGRKQTKGSGNKLALTTFVMTVNFSLDEDMRYACGYYIYIELR